MAELNHYWDIKNNLLSKMDKDLLHYYFDLGKSLRQIIKEYDSFALDHPLTLSRRIKSLGYALRNRPDAVKEHWKKRRQ